MDPRIKNERNWAIWRARRTTSATLDAIGREHGIHRARVQQLEAKGDRLARRAITRPLDTPTQDETREGILGIEFVFTHESLAEGAGWSTLATGTQWDEQSRSHVPTYSHALDEGIVYRVKKDA
jgi:hypothetical protein